MRDARGAGGGLEPAEPVPYLAYPTFARAARRPKWVGVLLFALAVAAGFAWLGQWQLGRAVETAFVEQRDTETVVPLTEALPLGEPMTDAAVDRMVSVSGTFVSGDFLVVGDRAEGGRTGYWVVGCLRPDGGGSVAVALGWTADQSVASAAAAQFDAVPGGVVRIVGRLSAAEAVDVDTSISAPDQVSRMSVAWLANVWQDASAPFLQGFVVAQQGGQAGTASLSVIDSPEPTAVAELNWLNLFYAAEWVIFSGFALFLWWRLVADDVRREREDLGFLPAEDEDDSGPDGGDPPGDPSAG